MYIDKLLPIYSNTFGNLNLNQFSCLIRLSAGGTGLGYRFHGDAVVLSRMIAMVQVCGNTIYSS